MKPFLKFLQYLLNFPLYKLNGELRSKKCRYKKVCSIYDPYSNTCNKTAGQYYGINRFAGCYVEKSKQLHTLKCMECGKTFYCPYKIFYCPDCNDKYHLIKTLK